MIRTLTAIAVLFVLFPHSVNGNVADFVVATTGDDSAPGSVAQPFATFGRAQDAVRDLRANGVKREIVVMVRGGTYRLSEPIVFTPEDSGHADGQTIYAAWPGEHPVFSGGAVLEGLTNRDGRWQATVGDRSMEQLYVNGTRATWARTPNELYRFASCRGPKPLAKRSFGCFKQDLEPLRGLSPEQLKRVVVTVYNSWEVSRHRIEAVDFETGLLTFTGPYFVDFFHFARPRYFFENLPKSLDVPGEWQADDSGCLSYAPCSGEEPKGAELVAPVLERLVEFRGTSGERVEHLVLRGLAFHHSAYRLPAEGMSSPQAACKIDGAIMLDHCENVLLESCEVAHTGNYAIWFRDGCQECQVQKCRMYDLGAGGVRLGICDLQQASDPVHATGHLTVDNCIIHDGGRIWQGAVGVLVTHSGDNRVTHNDIAGFRYTGVSVGWRWGYGEVPSQRNVISYNHIHHIGDILADMGGIYTLGEAPGTVLSHNVIHDLDGHGGSSMNGIYNDNSTSDMVMEKNLVYDVRDGGYKLGSGRANVVRNNIFVCGRQGHCYFCLYYPDRDKHVAVSVERNVFVGSPDPGAVGAYGGMFNGRDPGPFIRFQHNLYWAPRSDAIRLRGKTFTEWQQAGYDSDSVVADPMFFDPATHDYRLPAKSPLHEMGFEPFDPGQAGVYGDETWKELARASRFPPFRTVAPEPPPIELQDDFETTPIDEPPANAVAHSEGKGDRLVICDENAASGLHCVLFQDRQGLEHAFNPHLVYRPDHGRGRTSVRFALRLAPGAALCHEWRQYPGKPYYHTGPSFHIRDGQLTLGGKQRMTLPVGQWLRFEIGCTHGDGADGTWSLTVTLPGEAPRQFSNLAVGSPGPYNRLTWLGFISEADADVQFWLDDMEIANE